METIGANHKWAAEKLCQECLQWFEENKPYFLQAFPLEIAGAVKGLREKNEDYIAELTGVERKREDVVQFEPKLCRTRAEAVEAVTQQYKEEHCKEEVRHANSVNSFTLLPGVEGEPL